MRGLQDLKAGEQHPLPPSSSSKLPGLWGAVAGLVQRNPAGFQHPAARQAQAGSNRLQRAWEFIPRALQEKSTQSFQSSLSSPSR